MHQPIAKLDSEIERLNDPYYEETISCSVHLFKMSMVVTNSPKHIEILPSNFATRWQNVLRQGTLIQVEGSVRLTS
jgi:hypothetical protein